MKLARPVLSLLFAVLALANPAWAGDFSFTKVADTDTAIPGGSGTFGGFQSAPSLSGNNMAFTASAFGDGFMPGVHS